MNLPALPPALSASLIDALPSRLKRRAGALAADCASWAVDGDRVTVGGQVVTVADTVTCSCLLSPKCAHVGAVALAAPVADDPAPHVPTGAGPEMAPDMAPQAAPDAAGTAGQSGETAAAPPTATAAELERRRELAERARGFVDVVLARGICAIGIADHAAGLALLQAARAAGLPRLERALTGVVGASRSMRTTAPTGRDDLARRVGALATAAHELAADPGSPEAAGRARRTYSALDGRGTGTFTPVAAEPIVAASGFAGVVVTFTDGKGEFLRFAHAPPGDAADVRAAWLGRAALGDLHCSHAELARHRLLVSGGRTSADGRLGRGRGVRAALGAAITPDDLRGIDGYLLLEGTVISGDRRGFTLAESGEAGETGSTAPATHGRTHRLRFSGDARRAGLGDLIGWMAAQSGLRVVVKHGADGDGDTGGDGVVVRVWGDDGEQVFPGLDRPTVPRANKADPSAAPSDHAERGLTAPAPGVPELLADWAGLAVTGGATAVRARERRLLADAARLGDLAAPVAAELLRGLLDATDSTAMARIHVYLGR